MLLAGCAVWKLFSGTIPGSEADQIRRWVMSIKVRHMREEDRDELVRMHIEAFNTPAYGVGRIRSAPVDEGRVLTEDGRVLAGLRVLQCSQFFGSRLVPGAGISAVKVAAMARGKGLGNILMREVLAELRREGAAISTLYPTNLAIYRRAGYELAGILTRFQMPLVSMPQFDSPELEPWGDSALGEVAACYRRFAEASNGLIDRPASWWAERTLLPFSDGPVYRYLVRRGEVTGYLVYTQEHEKGDLPYYYSLLCRDLVWNDVESAHAILNFGAGHRTLGVNFAWHGPVDDPLNTLFEGPEARAQWSYCWMTRLVNVSMALEKRGYAPFLETEVELTVSDPVLPDNHGPIRLELRGGRGNVVRIHAARAQLDVGALAAIYTGWLSPRAAVRGGRLKDATNQEIERLEAIFAGPKPWMPDFF
jgi:predicted acetyltransferase